MDLILEQSSTPEFAYINAPAVPYKGMQLQSRVQNRTHKQRKSNLRLNKIMPKRKANTGGALASKRRRYFTGAEVEVLMQNVDVSILFH